MIIDVLQCLDKEIDKIKSLKTPIELNVLGSTALFLQSNYERKTKDIDFFEIEHTSSHPSFEASVIQKIGGKASGFHKLHGVFFEFVSKNILFIPQRPIFNTCDNINENFKNILLRVLDVHDVIVSKIKPYRPTDREDIKTMIEQGLVDHQKLVERFKLAMYKWELDRAYLFKDLIKNLNDMEQSFFEVEPSQFDLPRWADD
ncbi:MAG: hypothetical protein H7A33_02340 [Deltaproteobacteria bacterium]|nr:hypothetical protein [Deltaproteobacteria bacterium]